MILIPQTDKKMFLKKHNRAKNNHRASVEETLDCTKQKLTAAPFSATDSLQIHELTQRFSRTLATPSPRRILARTRAI